MRLLFGGTAADVYMVDDEEGDLRRGGGATALFYDAKDGGTQYTDLLDIGGAAITSVTTSTGSDGWAAGQLPFLYGPDGVFEMYVSVNGSPRVLMPAVNLGSYLGPMRSQLEAHLASGAHLTRLREMVDVDGTSLTNAVTGSTIVKAASGLWVAGAAATGGGGVAGVTLDTDQTITGSKTFDTGEVNKNRIVVQAAAIGQVGDVMVAYSGTDTGQGGARQRTFYLNEKGELRAIAGKSNSVAVRFKGQPGQTANIMEITDTSNVAKAWYAPNYAHYAPNSGRTQPFTVRGAVATGTGLFFWTNDLGVAMTLRSVRLRMGTAPTGQALIVDVLVNGVSVFATANRPTVAAGQTNSGMVNAFQSNQIPAGAELRADVIQVGNPVAGSDLTCQIELW